MKTYPVFLPRLQYELDYLDTFLQKLPSTKWNYVPDDIKELSKAIINYLRPSDTTRNYDFFLPWSTFFAFLYSTLSRAKNWG